MGPDAARRSWVEHIMGMPISLLGRGRGAHSEPADAAVKAVFHELTAVDGVFSPYKYDSPVSRLARGEIALPDCPPEVVNVAERCARARELTRGLFDANRPSGGWDPSGLVKGWAVERCARHLIDVVDVDWCVNAGGDVIVVAPSGGPFLVGIQDPRDPTRIAAWTPCASGAVATSGTAARGQHLYDPRSGGTASNRSLSVTVAGPSLELADVLATAAVVAGEDWAELVGDCPGYRALAIGSDGRIEVTSGWV